MHLVAESLDMASAEKDALRPDSTWNVVFLIIVHVNERILNLRMQNRSQGGTNFAQSTTNLSGLVAIFIYFPFSPSNSVHDTLNCSVTEVRDIWQNLIVPLAPTLRPPDCMAFPFIGTSNEIGGRIKRISDCRSAEERTSRFAWLHSSRDADFLKTVGSGKKKGQQIDIKILFVSSSCRLQFQM